MTKSLLFIPDISGYTKFVQSTEVEHSQHVIAELLEILIAANTQDLQLAEIEGDALFFFKERMVPSQEKLLAQMETMFTAFYSHLKLLEKNRICPCNACATAPNLELKIIAHCGDLQFLEVQGNRKPFGQSVIEAHRLLKNSVDSDNYVLITEPLAETIGLSATYQSALFRFHESEDVYDDQSMTYCYAKIDNEKLKIQQFERPQYVDLSSHNVAITVEKEFPVSTDALLEVITNYRHRHHWAKGVEEITYDSNEVTRLGSEHTCVIGGKHLDFVTVTKAAQPNELIYGELTTSPSPVDKLYQFFIITPRSDTTSVLRVELYLIAKSPIKKLIIALFAKRAFRKNMTSTLEDLHAFVS